MCMACVGQNKLVNDEEILTKYKLNKQLLADWNEDKNACKNIRWRHLDSIVSNKSLIGMKRKQFVKLFGEPDENYDKGSTLLYYTSAACTDSGKINRSTDAVWVLVIFEKGKLVKFQHQAN